MMRRRALLAALPALPAARRAGPIPCGPDDEAAVLRTVYGEAGAEPVAGQIAVAHVLCNRVASPDRAFAADVTLAAAACRHGQFRPLRAPDEVLPRLQSVVRHALALHRAGIDLSHGAQFFARIGCRAPWRDQVREVARYGHHAFSALVRP